MSIPFSLFSANEDVHMNDSSFQYQPVEYFDGANSAGNGSNSFPNLDAPHPIDPFQYINEPEEQEEYVQVSDAANNVQLDLPQLQALDNALFSQVQPSDAAQIQALDTALFFPQIQDLDTAFFSPKLSIQDHVQERNEDYIETDLSEFNAMDSSTRLSQPANSSDHIQAFDSLNKSPETLEVTALDAAVPLHQHGIIEAEEENQTDNDYNATEVDEKNFALGYYMEEARYVDLENVEDADLENVEDVDLDKDLESVEDVDLESVEDVDLESVEGVDLENIKDVDLENAEDPYLLPSRVDDDSMIVDSLSEEPIIDNDVEDIAVGTAGYRNVSDQTCPVCGELHDTNILLWTHLVHIHPGHKPFVCMHCGFNSNRRDHIYRHITRVHPEKDLFDCKSCTCRFQTERSHASHFREVHELAQPNLCADCLRRYKTAHRLRRHQRVEKHGPFKEGATKVSRNKLLQEGEGLEEQLQPNASSELIEQLNPGMPSENENDQVQENNQPVDASASAMSIDSVNSESAIGSNAETAVFEASPSHFVSNRSCRACGDVLDTIQLMWKHQADMHPHYRPLVCIHCGESKNHSNVLCSHMSSAHSDKPMFDCNSCRMRFQTEKGRDTHVHEVHELNRQHFCEDCHQGYTRLDNLRRHQRICMHGGFKNVEQLEESNNDPTQEVEEFEDGDIDMGVDSGNEAPLPGTDESVPSHYHFSANRTCHVCAEVLDTREVLWLHLAEMHPRDKPFVCIRCGERKNRRERLYNHIFRVHGDIGLFDCNSCRSRFQTERGRDTHFYEMHELKYPHGCGFDDCPRRFSSMEDLLSHQKLQKHGRLNEFVQLEGSNDNQAQENIRQVDATVMNIDSANDRPTPGINAENTAVGPSQFQDRTCQVCGEVLDSIKHMWEHLSDIHPHHMPLTCIQCGARKNRRDALMVHVMVHGDVILFACRLCRTRFQTEKGLGTHIYEKHELSRPHVCQDCPRRYTTVPNLEEHQWRRKHGSFKTA